ncbi:MAG: hypothetical protein Q7S40_33460 [Opitutaceae bacterium]|nr:hypothetical protein [Opitutaceae bacterium]
MPGSATRRIAIPHVYELMTTQAGHAFKTNRAPVSAPLTGPAVGCTSV